MKVRSICSSPWPCGAALAFTAVLLLGAHAPLAAQKPQHTGTRVEGFTTIVTPDTIVVFDRKNQEIEISTDKDYTSLVGIAVPVTVWYTTRDDVNHLEDIEYSHSATFVPRDQLADDIKRIIILPRVEDIDDSQGLITAISNYVAETTGWFVAPPDLALEIAARASGSSSPLDAADSDAGAMDPDEYMEQQRSLMQTVAMQSHTDAVLEVKLIKVKAHVRGSVASWDDMKESVASRMNRALSPMGEFLGRGWVYAATADMNLWSRSGRLLWNKRRGFAVLAVQSGLASRYRPRPLTEVYANSDVMQRWLSDTLGQLAPPTKVAPAGSSPLPPDLQQQLEKAKQAGQKEP